LGQKRPGKQMRPESRRSARRSAPPPRRPLYELIGIEHYGLDDDATAPSVLYLALRELLPLIEARRKPLAILHNFPDVIIVLASKPRCKICHSVLLQFLKKAARRSERKIAPTKHLLSGRHDDTVPQRQWSQWCISVYATSADLSLFSGSTLRTLTAQKEDAVAEATSTAFSYASRIGGLSRMTFFPAIPSAAACSVLRRLYRSLAVVLSSCFKLTIPYGKRLLAIASRGE
jgi:hypothetical protein